MGSPSKYIKESELEQSENISFENFWVVGWCSYDCNVSSGTFSTRFKNLRLEKNQACTMGPFSHIFKS